MMAINPWGKRLGWDSRVNSAGIIARNSLNFSIASAPCAFSRSAQSHVYPYLVAVCQKSYDLLGAHREVVFPGGKPDADAFKLRFFLFFPVLAFSLFPLVFEFAEIHDPAHGRDRCAGYFNQVQSLFLGLPQSLGCLHDSEILAVRPDHADGCGTDPLIDAISSLDRIEFKYIIDGDDRS